jgi:ubiquinone/menaquinone biosynthesis C-methylase UbiE
MIAKNSVETSAMPAGKNSGATASQPAPSPALLFDTINAYQKTAAIKAAIELDVFTAIGDGPATAQTIAARCHASPRGIRILCDYLTIVGFLSKSGDDYASTPDTALFLNRKSPAYVGGTLDFLLSNDLKGAFDQLTAAARKGGTAQSQHGTTSPEHPVWLPFARSMGPLMVPAAAGLADLIALDQTRPTKVLDISASHGMWGLAFAKKNPKTELVALDWAPVLEVAREHARAAGVADRFKTIAGSAFEVELGSDYDVVLVPNFLHHFSVVDCVRFLKRAHAALRPGGTVAIVEFVPNPDRVTPPAAAGFSLVMLATTSEGDAYTFAECSEMLAQAGFDTPTLRTLPASMNVAVIARRA